MILGMKNVALLVTLSLIKVSKSLPAVHHYSSSYKIPIAYIPNHFLFSFIQFQRTSSNLSLIAIIESAKLLFLGVVLGLDRCFLFCVVFGFLRVFLYFVFRCIPIHFSHSCILEHLGIQISFLIYSKRILKIFLSVL